MEKLIIDQIEINGQKHNKNKVFLSFEKAVSGVLQES